MSEKKIIGKILQEFLEETGISQNKLSKILDYSSSHISAIVNDKKIPGGDFFIALKSEYPNLNLDRFFTGEGPLFHEPPAGPIELDPARLHHVKHINLLLEILGSNTTAAEKVVNDLKERHEQMQLELKLRELEAADSSGKEQTSRP